MTRSSFFRLAPVVAAALSALPVHAGTSAAPGLSELSLGPANDPIRVIANQTSRDERHLASVIVRNGRHQVVHDGRPGPLHEGTVALDTQGSLTFSPGGERLAYTVIQGPDRWFTVIDGQPGATYDWVARNIVFSPDGRRVAYQAGTKKSAGDLKREEGLYDIRLVVDGVEGPLHESISFSSPVFSPDGRQVAYVARKGSKSVLIVDGKAGPEYNKIGMGRPVFSPDSRHLGYIADTGDGWVVVMDGREGPKHEYIPENSLVFSPDSRRWAHAVRVLRPAGPGGEPEERMHTVVDGQAGELYDAIDTITFSPDSRHVAYKARKDGFWRIVLNGEDGIEYPEIMEGWPVFSPDSTMLAYWLKTSAEKWTIFIKKFAGPSDKTDTGVACPCRGISGGQYDQIVTDSLLFSPDSRHVAFIAQSGDKKRVVLDGNLGEEFDDVGNLCFSPAGGRFAYWGIAGEKWRVIADGSQSGPDWDGIRGGIVFFGRPSDPDGVQLAYGAARGEARHLVVNGAIVGDYDRIATGLAAAPVGDGFEVLAVRDKTLYRAHWSAQNRVAAAPVPTAPAGPAPEPSPLRFEAAQHDFGKVLAGDPVTHDFVFTNPGPAPVEITGVEAACGCTTSEAAPQQVAPGGKGVIPLRLDTAQLGGAVAKTAEVRIKDHAPVVLELRGQVWRPVELNPAAALFNLLDGDTSRPPVAIRITSQLDQPLLLSDPRSDNPAFAATLATLEPGRRYQLLIRAIPPFSPDKARGTITLRTSSPALPELRVRAQAILAPAAAAAPAKDGPPAS